MVIGKVEVFVDSLAIVSNLRRESWLGFRGVRRGQGATAIVPHAVGGVKSELFTRSRTMAVGLRAQAAGVRRSGQHGQRRGNEDPHQHDQQQRSGGVPTHLP